MLLKSPSGCSTLLIVLFLVAPAANAQVFRGHLYQDQNAFVYGETGTTGTNSIGDLLSAVNGDPATTSGFSVGHLPEGNSRTTTLGSHAMTNGSKPSLPYATNALLRVWVDENAIVSVNGRVTKPQHCTGIYCNSRLFNLTGLMPNENKEVLVQVLTSDGEHLTPLAETTQSVQAGGSYEVVLQAPATNGPRPTVELVPAPIEDAVKRAETAAGNAKAAANAAKKSQEDAAQTYAEIEELKRKITELVAEAAQWAKQAARGNAETFDFEQDHKPLVAYVTYTEDGGISKLLFDQSTRETLLFKEKSKAMDKLNDVKVAINYYFTVETPTREVKRSFELLNQPVSFKLGEANVPFFNDRKPGELLSNEFKKKIMQKNWTEQDQDMNLLIKVEIKAVRPNGGVTDVAPVGKRITIELRQRHP